MIPERPAGDEGPRHRRRETPARGRVLPGVKPALLIFGGAAVLEYVAVWGFARTGDERFLLMAFAVAAGVLVVSLLAGSRLPRGERWPFWTVAGVCVAASTLLFAALCGGVIGG